MLLMTEIRHASSREQHKRHGPLMPCLTRYKDSAPSPQMMPLSKKATASQHELLTALTIPSRLIEE